MSVSELNPGDWFLLEIAFLLMLLSLAPLLPLLQRMSVIMNLRL
jgi:hypothetical protein